MNSGYRAGMSTGFHPSVKALQLQVSLMPHQREFVFDDTTPIQGFVGGYRAGKTEALVQKALRLATEVYPGKNGIIISPIAGMNQRNVVPIFRRILSKSGLVYDAERLANENVNRVDIEVGGGRISSIYLNVSAENYVRMNGMTLAWGGFDEADLCTSPDKAYNAFLELGNRLSDGDGVGLQFAVSTPEGYGFMYKRFVTEKNENTKIWHVSMLDNFLLPKGYTEGRLLSIPFSKQEAYISGQFCNINTNQVYTDWDRKLNHTDDTLATYPGQPVFVGMDFNVDKVAAVLHCVNKNGDPRALLQLRAVDVPAMIRMLKDVNNQYGLRGRHIVIYPDASGKNRDASDSTGRSSAIALLRQAGFVIKVRSKQPGVGNRIRAMNTMFQDATGRRRYLVNTLTCPSYADGLDQQGFDKENKPDKSATFGLDHELDGAGYFIEFEFPVKGDTTFRTQQ